MIAIIIIISDADSDVNIEDNIKLCPLCNIQKDICQTIRSSNFSESFFHVHVQYHENSLIKGYLL